MESIGREPKPQWTLPTEDQVRQRAYEIYQARAGGPGSPESDWIQAQRELTAALARKDGAEPDGQAGTGAKTVPQGMPQRVPAGVPSPTADGVADDVAKGSKGRAAKAVSQPVQRATRGKTGR